MSAVVQWGEYSGCCTAVERVQWVLWCCGRVQWVLWCSGEYSGCCDAVESTVGTAAQHQLRRVGAVVHWREYYSGCYTAVERVQ